MDIIKFGTDGWRAIIGDDYTIANLKRVSIATVEWLRKENKEPHVVIGYDCRFGGKMFAEAVTRVIAGEGIKVSLSPGFASTPMVSLACKQLNAGVGIIITASHNPPEYNGFKLKGNYGGPALPEMIEDVEKLIPNDLNHALKPIQDLQAAGLVEYYDMEEAYFQHAIKVFDIDAIRNSNITIAYDAMFGAGQNIVKRLLPDARMIHAEINPGFKGTPPEPIMKNLHGLKSLIQKEGTIDFAFATDGDADRIGILNGSGDFVDSHHIILLLINYLHKMKGMNGKVVNSFSCTSKITDLCKAYGIEQQITKIGFKYICGHMIEEDVLVGGEESGGIAVKGHIPERDGVWVALCILDYMATTGKSLNELIEEVYSVTGPFALERLDLHIEEKHKQLIISKLQISDIHGFQGHKVTGKETVDGFKFHLEDGEWVMFRPSGTEPVLRIYAEAATSAKAFDILESARETMFSSVAVA